MNWTMMLIATLFTVTLFAQNNHKLTFAAGLGASKLTGELGKGGSFGLNYLVDAKYFFTNQLSTGIEYNSSAIAYGNKESIIGIRAYGADLYLAKADYFLSNKKVKPYAGLGLGVAKISTPEILATNASGAMEVWIPAESKFNFVLSPRAGLMLGNWGLECIYNVAGKTPKSTQLNVSSSNKGFNFYTVSLRYSHSFKL